MGPEKQPTQSTRQIGQRTTLDTHAARLAWYAGLGAMAALEVIEWPIAALLAATHLIEHNARDGIVKQLTEGLEEGI